MHAGSFHCTLKFFTLKILLKQAKKQVEIKRENFLLFSTGAARYMSLTGKTLKDLYPSLMHANCVAHLLGNCAACLFIRIRAYFKNINEVIATMKETKIV